MSELLPRFSGQPHDTVQVRVQSGINAADQGNGKTCHAGAAMSRTISKPDRKLSEDLGDGTRA
jgi:hypothetical protein